MATFVSLELLLNSDTELGPLILSPFFSFLLFSPLLSFSSLSFSFFPCPSLPPRTSKTETTAFKHCYYFDNKEEAVSEHKKLKVKLYDQLTAPFLKKLDSKQSLSINDQMRLHAIFNRMDKLR